MPGDGHWNLALTFGARVSRYKKVGLDGKPMLNCSAACEILYTMNRMNRHAKNCSVFIRLAPLVILCGCGALAVQRTTFPNAVTNDQDVGFFVEDIEAIVDDLTLTEADRRQALQDLGIQDDDLITALLTLP